MKLRDYRESMLQEMRENPLELDAYIEAAIEDGEEAYKFVIDELSKAGLIH